MQTSLPSISLVSPLGNDKMKLAPTPEADTFDILETSSGKRLGTLHQPSDVPYTTELFWGKGGFMGSIISPKGIRYFVLPGGSVAVNGVKLSLDGEPIGSNPNRVAQTSPASSASKKQTASIQATILGAGLATRFERISGDSTQYSKPAVPLAGSVSVIECLANQLGTHGFSRVIVNTYFKPESLKASLARSQGVQIDYIDEAEPSGTAGGLRKMLLDPAYQGLLNREQPLLVVQGDSVTDADFSELMNAHTQHNALVTIGCQTVAEKDVDKFGIIITDKTGSDAQSGRIQAFQEKPALQEAKSRLGNTGFYIFSPKAYPMVAEIYQQLLAKAQKQANEEGRPVPDEVPMDFATDIFPVILEKTLADPEQGAFWAQTVSGYWSDIGNPAQYLESVHDVYAGKTKLPLPENRRDYYRDGIIYWHGAAAIADEEGAELQGNVVVAKPYSA